MLVIVFILIAVLLLSQILHRNLSGSLGINSCQSNQLLHSNSITTVKYLQCLNLIIAFCPILCPNKITIILFKVKVPITMEVMGRVPIICVTHKLGTGPNIYIFMIMKKREAIITHHPLFIILFKGSLIFGMKLIDVSAI